MNIDKSTALDLYITCTAQQWAANTAGTAMTQYLQEQVQRVWNTKPPRTYRRRRGRRRALQEQERQPTLRERTLAWVKEIEARLQPPTQQQQARRPIPATERWLKDHRKERWEKAAEGKRTPAWQTPWEINGQTLYQGLLKEEATLAFLLRSEIIGPLQLAL